MTAERILQRLQNAELAEPAIWYQQDYRQAFICVSVARGEPTPFVASSYRIYGTHPDLVWFKIMANRRERLGREFLDWFDQAGNLKPDLPKKKPSIYIDEAAAQATNERLAAVLMFPAGRITEVQRANVEQSASRCTHGGGTSVPEPQLTSPPYSHLPR